MQQLHRPQLIRNLSNTALGLIEEAEALDPQDAKALVELAGSLDRLRVKLISNDLAGREFTSLPKWVNGKTH